MLPPDRGFDLETDLLVIGAGAAGMTAALVGALEGLRVILCEKSDVVGGTTATSAGTVWIPGSRQSEAAGIPDSIEAAKTYLAAMLGKDAGDGRLDAYLASGPAVLDDLEKRSLVSFVPPPLHPDYRDLPGAALRGRALGTAPFDGRKLGADFDRVRPPRHEFTVLGGMMVGKNDIAPLLHPFRSWAISPMPRSCWRGRRCDRLRYRRGTRLIMGNALVARLLHDLKRQAVDIRYQTALEELVKDGDEVVGAILLSPEGKRAVRARKGVVLATGGIGWSEALRERLFPEQAAPHIAGACIQHRLRHPGRRARLRRDRAATGKPGTVDAELDDDTARTASSRCFRTSCSTAPSQVCWPSTRPESVLSMKPIRTTILSMRCCARTGWPQACPRTSSAIAASLRITVSA